MERRQVFIIAEAGVNHNGDLGLALEMVDVAADLGVDAIKFQSFDPNKLASAQAPKADYQKKDGEGSQLAMLRGLALSGDQQKQIYDHCHKKNIMFLSSAFDLESIELLRSIGQTIYKIPSGEITNLPYLRKIATVAEEVILSTGMSTMDDIGKALAVLQSGGIKNDKITILHCNTEYPTPITDVNLLAMVTIGKEFNVKIGYSDHTIGSDIATAAVALGAQVIEKHFTLDCSLPGPDHKASMEPINFKEMVARIRTVEQSLGDGIKRPTASETKNMIAARKSIVAKQPIAKGERFSESNLTVKRPGNGISPMAWDDIVGQVALRNFHVDELISICEDSK